MADETTAHSRAAAGNRQWPGAGRRPAGDDAAGAGTNGGASGTGGGRDFLTGWLVALPIVAVVVVVNSLTVLEDHPHLRWWEAWTWEVSSGLVILAIAWIPWLAARRAPPEGGRWLRFAGVHALALVAYSALHVGGFLALRRLAYAAVGETYRFDPLAQAFPYELRKDVLSYAALAVTFWLVRRLRERRAEAAAAAPATFDIRDGARVLRVRLDQVLAVRSAGNYVEFVLDDGRTPLMRSPLAALEAELDGKGFVRTHRSWLVNAARVTGLRPEGSGDYAVELGALEAPLSRRFRPALERLKGT